MGFSFRRMFSRRAVQGLLGGGGDPIVAQLMTNDKVNNTYEEIHKGIGNLITGGYIAQKEATEESEKARDEAQKRYEAETLAAEETAKKIAETEEERKRRLAMQGTQTPSTLLNSYLGVSGGANVRRSVLG